MFTYITMRLDARVVCIGQGCNTSRSQGMFTLHCGYTGTMQSSGMPVLTTGDLDFEYRYGVFSH